MDLREKSCDKGLSSYLKKSWYDFAKLSCSILLRFPLFYSIKVEGKENLPKGGYIIAANHLSFLDPVLISVGLNKRVYFLAKYSSVQKDEFDKSFYGRLINSLDQIIIKEGYVSTSSLKKSFNFLKAGRILGAFPEGTRSYNGKLCKLEEGIAGIADLSGVPVVPVYINGSFEAWSRYKKFPKPFGQMRIRIEEPIYARDIRGRRERRKDIMDRLEVRLRYLDSLYS